LAVLSPRQTNGVKDTTDLTDGNFRLDTDPVDLLRHIRVFPQDAIAPDILQGLGIDTCPQPFQVAHQRTGLNHIRHSLLQGLTERPLQSTHTRCGLVVLDDGPYSGGDILRCRGRQAVSIHTEEESNSEANAAPPWSHTTYSPGRRSGVRPCVT